MLFLIVSTYTPPLFGTPQHERALVRFDSGNRRDAHPLLCCDNGIEGAFMRTSK